MVELDDERGELGLRRPERADRVDRVLDRPDLLGPQRMRNSRPGEQPATAALGPKPGMLGIGAEQRNIERERNVALERGRVVWHEVRELRIGERTPDLLEHIGPFQQLLAQRPGTAVAQRDEPQTPPRRQPESPG